MLSYDVRSFLIQKDIVGGSTGWEAYVGYIPDDAANFITVLDSNTQVPDEFYRFPTINIQLVGDEYKYMDAQRKAEEIFSALDLPTDLTTTHIGMRPNSDIIFIGYDTNRRPMFSLNFISILSKGRC